MKGFLPTVTVFNSPLLFAMALCIVSTPHPVSAAMADTYVIASTAATEPNSAMKRYQGGRTGGR